MDNFNYLTEIKNTDGEILASKQVTTLIEAVRYAEKWTIQGDLVVITEGYMGADGVFDRHDHVASWYVT